MSEVKALGCLCEVDIVINGHEADIKEFGEQDWKEISDDDLCSCTSCKFISLQTPALEFRSICLNPNSQNFLEDMPLSPDDICDCYQMVGWMARIDGESEFKER